MLFGEASFLTKDLGDVRRESLGVVVVVVVVSGVAPSSGEDSTSFEVGGVCPGDVLRPRGRLEREPGRVVGPRDDTPTLEGTILFLGAAEDAAAGEADFLVAGEVLLCPGGVLLSPREGLLDTVVIARPAHVAAAGEGVVVVVFFPVEETVVGGGLPVVRLLLGRGDGDSGGQEVARLPADARVFVAALDVVAGDVFLIEPLLSEPLELGECCVFFSRVCASRPGNSDGEGAPLVREIPGGLVRQVVLTKIDVAGTLVSPLVVGFRVCGAGGLEAVFGTFDARVVLEKPSRLDVVTATVVVAVLVVAVHLIVFCNGRCFCRDRLPGAVEKSLL